MRIAGLAASAATLVLSGVLVAQERLAFRAEANYVEVDAVVTDAAGRFVPGLAATDFDLRENRKPQQVSAFAYVELPDSSSGVLTPSRSIVYRPDLPQAARVDADRIYLLYLSPVEARHVSAIRRQASDFVTEFLKDHDMAAVWDAESNGREVEFTNDKAVLLKRISVFSGFANGLPETVPRKVGLKDAIEWVSAVQGRRKSLILFSAGMLDGGNLQVIDLQRTLLGLSLLDNARIHERPLFSLADLIERADIHIYPTDVRGLVAPAPPGSMSAVQVVDFVTKDYESINADVANMLSVANATGGLAIASRNDYRAGFSRIVEDNSRYYLLGYHSTSKVPNGYFRMIDLRVNRPGVMVRARKGYISR